MYRRVIKPVLFSLTIEQAHHAVLLLLRIIGLIPGGRWLLRKCYAVEHPALEREVFGIRFANPIGLAAGFDHNGEAFRELAALGFGFVNLGASGQCKLDTFFARIAAETRADAFLFDAFSNPSAQQIDERLEGFVRRIRESHPTTPLIFLQTEVRESGNFDLKERAFEAAKREAARKGMGKLIERDKNI